LNNLENTPNASLKSLDSYEKNELANILTIASSFIRKFEEMIVDLSNAYNQAMYYYRQCPTIIGEVLLLIFFLWSPCVVIYAYMISSKAFYEQEIIGLWGWEHTAPGPEISMPRVAIGIIIGAFVLLISIIILILLINNKRKKKQLYSTKYQEWMNYYTSLNETISYYFENELCNSPAVLIPPDFRQSAVLDRMVNYVYNMEAATWKECVSVWKTDIYRTNMEAEAAATRRLTQQVVANTQQVIANTAATRDYARQTAGYSKSAATASWLNYFFK